MIPITVCVTGLLIVAFMAVMVSDYFGGDNERLR